MLTNSDCFDLGTSLSEKKNVLSQCSGASYVGHRPRAIYFVKDIQTHRQTDIFCHARARRPHITVCRWTVSKLSVNFLKNVCFQCLTSVNKKISSCAVDTDVVVLVISVVQQLRVAKQHMSGWQKSLASLGMESNCLAFFIHSQGAIKHPLSSVGKLFNRNWVFCKNEPSP